MQSRRSFLTQSSAAIASLGISCAEPESQHLIIDTHIHVYTFDPRFPFNHPERPDLKRLSMEAPVENLAAQMKEFGVKYSVLVQPRYYGWDNSYMSYCIQKYPELFVAIGLIEPEDPKVAGKLRYWVTGHGFQGMRFSPIYHPKSTWLNSKEHYPLWREAEKLGAVFKYYILPHQIPMLEDMAERFPGVKIVIDHAGKPDLKKSDPWPEFRKVFRLKRFPQVWITMGGPWEMSQIKQYPYSDTYPFYKAVYEEFGGKKLVWGTGWPRPRWILTMDKELEWVNVILDFYTPEDRELVLGRNALDIWKFPG